jgi:hypothetical protein
VLNFFAVNTFPMSNFLDEMMKRVQVKNTRKRESGSQAGRGYVIIRGRKG